MNKKEIKKIITKLHNVSVSFYHSHRLENEISKVISPLLKYQNSWVSVDKKLPTKDMALGFYWCLVATSGGMVKEAKYHIGGQRFCACKSIDEIKGVTHWMPLPEAPTK